MNPTLKGVQKVLASLTMATTVLGLAGFAALTPVTALAVAPSEHASDVDSRSRDQFVAHAS